MFEILSKKKAYVFWFLFYFLLFGLILGANATGFLIVLAVYTVSISFALSSYAEALWRVVSGVRPLRLKIEKDRLLPLFREVYAAVIHIHYNFPKHIRLYIKEDMDVNAFAFGRKTLVLTRGSIQLLSDEGLKGLMAHEFGHFRNHDTVATLFMTVGNFFVSFLTRVLDEIKKKLDMWSKDSFMVGFLKIFFDFAYCYVKGIQFIGDLIIMKNSRKSEYQADLFADKCGYGKELADVLTEIYMQSITKPQSIKELLRSSHPPMTMRIEKLEKYVYYK